MRGVKKGNKEFGCNAFELLWRDTGVAQAPGSLPGASPGGVEVLLPVPKHPPEKKQAPARVPVPHKPIPPALRAPVSKRMMPPTAGCDLCGIPEPVRATDPAPRS